MCLLSHAITSPACHGITHLLCELSTGALLYTYVGVASGQVQQLIASVNATWLAALPGDVSVPDQAVLQGATQGTADSTGYIRIPNVVLLATAGVYNLSLTLQGYPEVRTWTTLSASTKWWWRECLLMMIGALVTSGTASACVGLPKAA